jgi:hypothetical protein
MTTQQYFEVDNSTNVVTNSVIWDGGNDWTPPENTTMLVSSTTPAMLWTYDAKTKTYVLTEVIGAGQVGFTWNGTALITNEPQPTIESQPKTTGIATA